MAMSYPALLLEPPAAGVPPGAPAASLTEPATAPDLAVAPRASVPSKLPPTAALVNADAARTPWRAAAAGGVVLGRKSKDAGVATAGFFNRFGRRVAGSFQGVR
jgi:hypothetical protein